MACTIPETSSIRFFSKCFFSGTITTSTTLYGLIAILVNKPEIQKKMADQILEMIGRRKPHLSDRKALVYIEAAILEVLRYSTINPVSIPHCTTKDTTIGGFDIPKDTQVSVYVPKSLGIDIIISETYKNILFKFFIYSNFSLQCQGHGIWNDDCK